MPKYNPSKIEEKWQSIWAKNRQLSEADEKSKKPKFYCLDMFPYPSGDGLHVGHVEGYTALDIYSRYLCMNGKNVLHPMGWDAFGLPAENYAIKSGVHPAESTKKNIKIFTKQIKSLGLSYDWSREIDTSSPEYYKWTQWFFLFLYKNGLAYRKKAKVNWCESCKTVLANEQVEDGRCERCKNEVVQKEMKQWFFKITDFAEDLIEGLDKIDWPESTKTAQRNWIGCSEGAIVKFPIVPKVQLSEKFLKLNFRKGENLEVFTTRLDTIYGCTYCVVAPEHEIIENSKKQIENLKEVEKHIEQAKKKTEIQRTDLAKEKTGVEIKGVKAVNPFTNEAVPIYVADYILSTYGTGAVMAVPAHDERDFEFARKYGLLIKKVIEPCFCQFTEPGKIKSGEPFVEREAIMAVVKHWEKDAYLGLKWKQVDWKTFVTGGPKEGQTAEEAARNEVIEETGYKNLKLVKKLPRVHGKFYHVPKKLNRFAHFTVFYFELENGERQNVSKVDQNRHEVVWVPKEKVEQFLTPDSHKYIWQTLQERDTAYTGDGVLADSGEFTGQESAEACSKMAKWLEKNNLGGRKTTYKLRDWLISRQRYWGAPIPMVHCKKCGWQPVPEKDLPVILPEVKDYRPKGTSPLGTNPEFVNTTCPKCKGKAKRETDTMDTFVCSSWYFFRFADPKNEKEFASKEKIKKWLPVDLYIGGVEHTVLHLLYSRFFTKALHKYKYIDFDEPFVKLRHQGIVLAEDGRKMSKSLGNVINPDDIVKEYSADTLRLYEMFMGPLEDSKVWNTKSIVGLKRFLERIWKLRPVISEQACPHCYAKRCRRGSVNNNLEILLHKTVKKVTEDIENLRFNTAISALMILLNALEKQEKIFTVHCSLFTVLLSPFAPHIAEELWSKLGHKESIFLQPWPEYDPKLVKDEEKTIVIQINGKLHDQIKVPAGTNEKKVKEISLKSEKVKKYIAGRKIKKIVFIKDRLINFVV